MRKRILALEMQDSRAVKRNLALEMQDKLQSAIQFDEKSGQGCVVRQWCPDPVFSYADLLPAALRGQLPQGGENETVKPFWKSILEREEKLVSTFRMDMKWDILDQRLSIPAQSPGLLLANMLALEIANACEYVGFGDCKGSKWTGTSGAEKGQIMQYGHWMLDAQPQRSHVYGFFTNNACVVLIRAERTGERPFGVFWGISAVTTFEHGMKTFFRLREQDHGFVAPPAVAGSPLVISRQLHPGGTCRAFAATNEAWLLNFMLIQVRMYPRLKG